VLQVQVSVLVVEVFQAEQVLEVMKQSSYATVAKDTMVKV
jgi:hypothetical protein